MQHQNQYGRSGGGGTQLAMPSLTPVVKYLLVINVVVFVLQLISKGALKEFFAATGQPWWASLQVWRLITFQFLHDTQGFMHIAFNMIGLYFLGTMIERVWGSKRFLIFYLTCGVVGGAIFTIASMAGAFGASVLIGASGGVLGLLVACAILFPHVKVLLFFIVPVPIRVIAIGVGVLYFLNVLRHFTGSDVPGSNAGGDLCHLGGMAVGFLWIYGRPYFLQVSGKLRQNKQNKQYSQAIDEGREVDRILEKVGQHGLHSLTRREKDALRRATERQKQSRQ